MNIKNLTFLSQPFLIDNIFLIFITVCLSNLTVLYHYVYLNEHLLRLIISIVDKKREVLLFSGVQIRLHITKEFNHNFAERILTESAHLKQGSIGLQKEDDVQDSFSLEIAMSE